MVELLEFVGAGHCYMKMTCFHITIHILMHLNIGKMKLDTNKSSSEHCILLHSLIICCLCITLLVNFSKGRKQYLKQDNYMMNKNNHCFVISRFSTDSRSVDISFHYISIIEIKHFYSI